MQLRMEHLDLSLKIDGNHICIFPKNKCFPVGTCEVREIDIPVPLQMNKQLPKPENADWTSKDAELCRVLNLRRCSLRRLGAVRTPKKIENYEVQDFFSPSMTIVQHIIEQWQKIADGDFESIFGGLFLPKFGLQHTYIRTSAHPRGLAVAPAALAAPGSLPAARNCTLGFPWHRSPNITCKIGEEDFNPNLMQS